MLNKLYEKYSTVDLRRMDDYAKVELREYLSSNDKVTSLEEHKKFLALLSIYRKTVSNDLKHVGERFVQQVSSLLSVGSDGMYTKENRFIYELI